MAVRKSGGCFGNAVTVVLGIVFAVAAGGGLFWNELRTLKLGAALEEGQKTVIAADPVEIDPAKNGKLVHVSSVAGVSEQLEDQEFGVVLHEVIKLKREVKVYQWEESHSRDDYSYSKIWSEKLIDSSYFSDRSGHQNPEAKPFDSLTFTPGGVAVGSYALNQELIDAVELTDELTYTSEMLALANPSVQARAKFTQDGVLYFGDDPETPQIGDAMVTFRYTPAGPVTVVAGQTEMGFAPYTTKGGQSLQLIALGELSAEEVIGNEHTRNSIIAWLVRLGAAFFIWVGIMIVSGPVRADAGGTLANVGGCGVVVLAGVLALAITLFLVAASWLVYKPLAALAMIVAAAVAGGALVVLLKRGQPRQKPGYGLVSQSGTGTPPPPPPPPANT